MQVEYFEVTTRTLEKGHHGRHGVRAFVLWIHFC